MPYTLPRDRTPQAAYDRDLERRGLDVPVTTYTPPAPDDLASLRDLGELHRNGTLTDDEFVAAKRRVLDGDP